MGRTLQQCSRLKIQDVWRPKSALKSEWSMPIAPVAPAASTSQPPPSRTLIGRVSHRQESTLTFIANTEGRFRKREKMKRETKRMKNEKKNS